MDRTAWIVVVLCVAGLFGWGWWTQRETAKQVKALEVQRALQAEAKAAEAAKPVAPASSAEAPAPTATASKEGPVDAREVILENDVIRVHLTNLGGGIQSAELRDHTRTMDEKDGFIVINEMGEKPVGALSEGPGSIDDTAWKITEDSGKAVAFSRVTPEKLEVTKRFVLPEAGKEQHQLVLEVSIRNTGEQTVQTGGQFLYLGSAAPLHPDEWPRQTGFYFLDGKGGDVLYKGADYFQGRKFLGMGSGPKAHDEFQINLMEWAGVNDQFFTTLLRPMEPYAASMWASRFPIRIKGQEAASQKKQLHAVEAAVSLPDIALA
ncbi:MAG: membrane protein insertase YidC, partial [Verrucomicrobiae bacterium]|nr:membrane protein insertase YidC [Verrucomicrobiae bacterium]